MKLIILNMFGERIQFMYAGSLLHEREEIKANGNRWGKSGIREPGIRKFLFAGSQSNKTSETLVPGQTKECGGSAKDRSLG